MAAYFWGLAKGYRGSDEAVLGIRFLDSGASSFWLLPIACLCCGMAGMSCARVPG